MTTGFGDTPQSRCLYYRRICGLPAVIDPPELGRIILRTGSVWGVTMPIRLGQRVKAHIQSRGDALGPIVAHPRSGRWTFLTDPDIELADVAMFAELWRSNVTIAHTGGGDRPAIAHGGWRHTALDRASAQHVSPVGSHGSHGPAGMGR
ncbi:DNA-directed RNA polymerase subunit beta [Nocardia sp. R6R-6]|uniref:DNA-directed RNA polymerase subunit beta n=1 Tax=Nocardia sp. R6R-6 TaxID=3459303 RepID=UPI00403D9054